RCVSEPVAVVRKLRFALLETPLNFFLSSRRRHTRSYGDWSSDVCSSDLATTISFLQRDRGRAGHKKEIVVAATEGESKDQQATRSEERRVGKEGSARGRACQQREKGIAPYQIGNGGNELHVG